MPGKNCSRNLAQQRARMTLMDLLTFLLAVLCVPTMVGMAGAGTWDETIAKAKKEGELVAVLGGGASRRYRPIFQYFEARFGLRTVVSTGGGGKQVDRLLAERRARKYKVDIVMVGGTLGSGRLLPNGVIDPIRPVLFLPEVVDRSLWYKGKHHYSDSEQKYIFAFSGGADLTPVSMRFNTDKLPIKKAKKIDSVWTFLDKRFAGKIVALPPTAAGATGSYSLVPYHPDLGEKYLRRFFSPELGVKFSRDYRLIADGVAKGKYTMAIFVGSAGRDIDRLGERGLPVANFGEIIDGPVKERPTLQGTSSSSNLMVVNRRPHANAAKLFVNWFLSKEGQTVIHTKSERSPSQSFRVDVTEMGKVSKADMRKPGIDYVTLAHDPEVLKTQLEALKRSRELYRKSRSR